MLFDVRGDGSTGIPEEMALMSGQLQALSAMDEVPQAYPQRVVSDEPEVQCATVAELVLLIGKGLLRLKVAIRFDENVYAVVRVFIIQGHNLQSQRYPHAKNETNGNTYESPEPLRFQLCHTCNRLPVMNDTRYQDTHMWIT